MKRWRIGRDNDISFAFKRQNRIISANYECPHSGAATIKVAVECRAMKVRPQLAAERSEAVPGAYHKVAKGIEQTIEADGLLILPA